MEITKFSEKDMETAIGMAQHAWHGYYDEFRAAYIRCIAECIVRHNYTDEDLGIAGEPIYENESAGDSSTNNLTLEDVYQDPNIVEYPMSDQTNRIATPLQQKEGATAPSSRLF